MKLTRRRALAAAAAGPAVAIAAARPAGAQETEPAGDAAVLLDVWVAEGVAEAAYRAVAEGAGGRVARLARRLGAHESQHLHALRTAFEALGAHRPPPPEDPAALDAALARLRLPTVGGVAGDEAALGLLLALEEVLVGRWIRAHRDLEAANLVQMATQVLCCQAQHLVVLRDALGRPALPGALETGS